MTIKQQGSINYFLTMDTPYKGQWVALFKGKVVASGRNAKTVFDKATKKYRVEELTFSQIPKYDVAIY